MEENINKTNQLKENLDCEGFLSDKNFWSTDVAETLAKDHKIAEIKLSEDQWKVINFVRDYYQKHGSGPAIIKVAKHCSLSMKKICELFPCGMVKGAYRLAGLPKPPGCA